MYCTGHVSQLYEITGKIRILSVLVFMFLDNRREDNSFRPIGSGLFWIRSALNILMNAILIGYLVANI